MRRTRSRRRALSTAVATGLLLAACQVDRYEVAYTDLVEARQQDAIDRGWVPEWLPESTTDIREVHDPGTGARVLTATLVDTAAFDRHCPIPAGDAPPVPFADVDLSVDALADARSCGGAGYGVLVGTRLVVWRDEEPEPTTTPTTTTTTTPTDPSPGTGTTP